MLTSLLATRYLLVTYSTLLNGFYTTLRFRGLYQAAYKGYCPDTLLP